MGFRTGELGESSAGDGRRRRVRVVGGLTSAWRLSWAHPRLRPRGSRRAERCPRFLMARATLNILSTSAVSRCDCVAASSAVRVPPRADSSSTSMSSSSSRDSASSSTSRRDEEAAATASSGGAEARSSPRARANAEVASARSRPASRETTRHGRCPGARGRRPRANVDGPNRPTPARSEANASARTTDARRLDANSRLRRMCSRTRAAPRASPCAPAESAPRPKKQQFARATNWSSAATSGKFETAGACPRTERRRRARIRARAWTSYLRACVS